MRRNIIISIVLLAITVTAGWSQRPGRDPGRDRGPAMFGGPFIKRLQQRLNLTETQVNGIRALAETHRREMRDLQQEIRPKREALQSLMEQPNPDPTELGNAMLALRETRQKDCSIQERFRTGILNVLTPEQRNMIKGDLRPLIGRAGPGC